MMTSILNGIVGDYLDASGNELATQMAFYRQGRPLLLSDLQEELRLAVATTTTTTTTSTTNRRNKLCILLHGLVNDESAWNFPDGSGDYGSFLQRDSNNNIVNNNNIDIDNMTTVTPLYLRYNTGLHVSVNGRKFDQLLQDLLLPPLLQASYEIALLCHSMGGLVARSATHHAMEMNTVSNTNTNTNNNNNNNKELQSSSWIHQLSTIIFLGTPHHGSYWERAGNVVSSALTAIPRPYTKLASKVANLRSSGIQDLRYGYVLDEDWTNEDSNAFWTNTKKGNEQLLDWVSYRVATGTITTDPNHVLSRIFGDALVTKSSARGHSKVVDHHLDFGGSGISGNGNGNGNGNDELCCHGETTAPTMPLIREFPGIPHTALQCHRDVYLQIKEWVHMADPPPSPPPPSLPTFDTDNISTRMVLEQQQPLQQQQQGGGGESASLVSVLQDDTYTTTSADDGGDEGECDRGETVVVADYSRTMTPTTSLPQSSLPPPSSQQSHSTTIGKYRGAVSLVQNAVHAGATAVEGVQTELTDEVYTALGYITPIAPVVRGVHVIHTGIAAGIYGMIRGINYGAGESMKHVLDHVETTREVLDAVPGQI